MTTKQTKPRFKVIAWQRGSYGILDTSLPIGTPGRRLGVGFKHKREAEAEARRLNRQDRERA